MAADQEQQPERSASSPPEADTSGYVGNPEGHESRATQPAGPNDRPDTRGPLLGL